MEEGGKEEWKREERRKKKTITFGAAEYSFNFRAVLGAFRVPAAAGGNYPNGIGKAGLPGFASNG
jgi:hypothetical protein